MVTPVASKNPAAYRVKMFMYQTACSLSNEITGSLLQPRVRQATIGLRIGQPHLWTNRFSRGGAAQRDAQPTARNPCFPKTRIRADGFDRLPEPKTWEVLAFRAPPNPASSSSKLEGFGRLRTSGGWSMFILTHRPSPELLRLGFCVRDCFHPF